MSNQRETAEVVWQVHERFRGRGLTLSGAESCTGGLISHCLTELAGASAFFHAGVVSYSVEAKKIILGVSEDTISQWGVVSEQTAREMAWRVRLISKTDYAVSSTGNLGPDVLDGKERGLVYVAVSAEKGLFSRELRLSGDRKTNKEAASLAALRLLLEVMER
ncbi:MAG TPA: CinA family protein [Dissulfurispiraceae bacterium]|nr:CinA family protein [Dissulfurispiraceae bacterium]